MRNLLGTLALTMGLMAGAAVAHAATLTDISGEVRVNGGDGFKIVSGTVTVQPGDIIMAGAKASARIVYSEKYSVPVEPGRIKTVAKSGEQAMRLAKLRSSAMRQSAGGGSAAAGTQCLPGVPLIYCVVGGAAAIGGGIAIIASSGDSNNKRLSK